MSFYYSADEWQKTWSNVDPLGESTHEKASGEMALETNEDSSYDSDFETDDTCTSHADISRMASSGHTHQNVSRNSSAGLSSTHHDVSRTVSDTLGAEFAEYINTDNQSAADEAQNKKLPGYATKVEFAVKLGYTEKLVQSALQKLGPSPSNNELLAELIKLGAQTCRVPETSVNCCNETSTYTTSHLRPIVIDGSNLAMSHGNKEVFSCRGIKICVDWFKGRGHKEITVFVPKWRKEASRPDNPITDREILDELERERMLVFTPSRHVGGKRMVCYDDRYILKLAFEVDGIVVSNDNYRDLAQENCDYRKVVEERILMFSFVNDRFMPPDDPMGRSGPKLENFLKMAKRSESLSTCPYGKKCTYGNKCKYNHPERGNMPHKSVTECLSEHAQKHIPAKGNLRESSPRNDLKTNSLPLSYDSHGAVPRKVPLSRTRSAAPALPPPDSLNHASVISHFNRAQQEYHQTISPDYQSMNRKMEVPPKSHSIENISSGMKDINLGCSSPLGNQGMGYPQPGAWGSGMMPPRDSSSWNRYMEGQETPEPGNMHRKLHRQLTLNPNYDPRLYRMHGCNHINPGCGTQQGMWGGHQSVGRIASAPAACPSWPWGTQAPPQPPPPQQAQPQQHPQHSTHHEARTHIHYHLASLFPEDKVQKAMALYPDEINPQNICAAIINQK